MVAKKPEKPERAAMSTQRISLDDLEKLKQQSRIPGPLPGLPQLFALIGTSLDDDAALDLGLKEKRGAGGATQASSKALGIEVVAGRGRIIETILLHAQGHDGFHAWPGDLGGVTFSSSPAQLKKLRGPPTRSSTGWDRWDDERGSLHVEYGGGGVQLITLTSVTVIDPAR